MIEKLVRIFLFAACYTFSLIALAESDAEKDKAYSAIEQKQVEKILPQLQAEEQPIAPQPQLKETIQPEVGKHVMANMDAGSMILSLLMVLALIVICALILKRFNLTQHSASQLKLVTSLSLGTKERVVVIQAGKQQLLLGITAHQITVLERLAEPLSTEQIDTNALPKNILSLLATRRT